MALSLLKLKRNAIEAGMDKDEAKSADRSELEAFLAKGSKSSTVTKKKAGKKSAKVAAKKAGTASKKSSKNSDDEDTPKRGRGRPKGSKNKTTKNSKSTSGSAAKSTKATSKKAASSTGKAKQRTSKKASSNDGGRNMVGKLDFKNYDEDDWSPREGSGTDVIFRALKKANGDVEKAFEALKDSYKDLTEGENRSTGEKKDKATRLDMLRYRILRTRFEFGRRTGQHVSSANRIEYGTGPNAQERKKADRKAKRGAPEKKATAKKATATKSTGKKRGRPKGSKNKK